MIFFWYFVYLKYIQISLNFYFSLKCDFFFKRNYDKMVKKLDLELFFSKATINQKYYVV